MTASTETSTLANDEKTTFTALDNVSIKLDCPIKRGASIIEQLTILRPTTSALRGLNLMDIAQINVSALQKLLPRITSPALTENEIAF